MTIKLPQGPISVIKRDLSRYNELLIERGDLSPYLMKLKHWAEELEKDNYLKEGKKFTYPNVLFQILTIELNLKRTYRMVEGFARMICGFLGLPAPRWSTIWYRIQKIDLHAFFQDKPNSYGLIGGAIDSSGFKLNGPGEWLHHKHHPSQRKQWLKLHTVVNADTHQILVKALTEGTANDGPQMKPMVEKAVKFHNFHTFWGDKAYASHENFEVLSVNKITPGILPKKNASSKTRGGSFARSRTVWRIKKVGEKQWKKEVEYNRRWAVERSYSIFKFLFGEKVRSRKWPYIVQEITLKITQMNHYLNELYDE